jgi:hypothetical protein
VWRIRVESKVSVLSPIGEENHTALAKVQWKNNCEPVSNIPHLEQNRSNKKFTK